MPHRSETEDADRSPEGHLWPLPSHSAPHTPPEPTPEDRTIVADWRLAEAGVAAHLARIAGRMGALDDRLRRGPDGWRHRLALIEASDLGWFFGDRITPDRLALWTALRLSGVQDDAAALARMGWAARRLTGGPGPMANLADFLGRHDPEALDPDADRFDDRAGSWHAVIDAGHALHPITRACMGYHLWSLAGLDPQGDRIEAAVTAARLAASEGQAAIFAPLAMGGGAGGLRTAGPPSARLHQWLVGMDRAILTAMRHLDGIEAWALRADRTLAPLSGRTPPALRRVLTQWPVISIPMAEALTGASRASVQRNMIWMQQNGLVREITGQGRFRMWKAAD